MKEKPIYSFRADPQVPAFADNHPVVFMDGACALCTTTARLIARLDRRGEFRICPVQSPLGQAILRHYGLNPDDPDTWLYMVDGRVYGSMEGMIQAGRRMGGLAKIIEICALLPKAWQDWIYQKIARNRIRWFGRADMCAVPDAKLRARLIS